MTESEKDKIFQRGFEYGFREGYKEALKKVMEKIQALEGESSEVIHSDALVAYFYLIVEMKEVIKKLASHEE